MRGRLLIMHLMVRRQSQHVLTDVLVVHASLHVLKHGRGQLIAFKEGVYLLDLRSHMTKFFGRTSIKDDTMNDPDDRPGSA